MSTNEQIIKRFKHFTKIAVLIQRERELSKRCRAMRDEIQALRGTDKGYFTSWHGEHGVDKTMTIQVSLAEYLACFPDARPQTWNIPDTNEARLEYPEMLVGEADGMPLHIAAHSERFTLSSVPSESVAA